jgi:hypothetical protein
MKKLSAFQANGLTLHKDIIAILCILKVYSTITQEKKYATKFVKLLLQFKLQNCNIINININIIGTCPILCYK